MKRTLLFLVVALFFSGVTFAAFPVQKTAKVENSEAIVNQEVNTSEVMIDVPATDDQGTASEEKSGDIDTVALILAIVSVVFLPFGLHNWYLGRTKQALWQTLLIIPLGILIVPAIISWIWQVVDLIRILTGSLS